jgi:hypothetical protein
MKNDSTTTFLNFVLAALVILGVLFALLSIYRVRDQRQDQTQLQNFQVAATKAQGLLNDAILYNSTAKNPEMAAIIQSVTGPAPAK